MTDASVGDGRGERTWEELYRERGVVQREPSPEARRALDAFREAGAVKVLDLGCGSGRHSRLLADGGFRVWGCDPSPEALAIAAEWVPEADFRQGEMARLPYEDGFFDAVLCYQVIQHALVADIRRAVAETARALRPDGLLFLRVPSAEHPEAQTGREVEPGTRLGIDAIDGGLPHHYFTREEIEALFAAWALLDLRHIRHASEKAPTRMSASWSLLARRPA